MLIECHAKFLVKFASKTEFLPIQLASHFGLPTLIQCLIAFGCDLDSLRDLDDTALVVYAIYMQVQCLKVLTRVGSKGVKADVKTEVTYDRALKLELVPAWLVLKFYINCH